MTLIQNFKYTALYDRNMRISILPLLLIAAFLYGCSSNDDSTDSSSSDSLNIASTEIVSFSGGEIPLEADLAIFWLVPDEGLSEPGEIIVSGGGSLSNGSFFVEPPNPIPNELVSVDAGVATGLVFAYPKGEAPVAGIYDEPESDGFTFSTAIGIVNNFAVIYRVENFTSTLLEDARAAGFELWQDEFEDGYSCARAYQVEDRGVDAFEPTDCASMVLSIGIVNEMELVGPDWF